VTADPRLSLARAVRAHQHTRHGLLRAVAESYGAVSVTEMADIMGVSRPTVYADLREAGVRVKTRQPTAATLG
jgi:DeoR/GlpR family transcriptional regulator of sugar metabolism